MPKKKDGDVPQLIIQQLIASHPIICAVRCVICVFPEAWYLVNSIMKFWFQQNDHQICLKTKKTKSFRLKQFVNGLLKYVLYLCRNASKTLTLLINSLVPHQHIQILIDLTNSVTMQNLINHMSLIICQTFSVLYHTRIH